MKNFLRKFGSSANTNTPSNRSAPIKPAFRWIIDRQLAVGPIPNETLHGQLLAAGFQSVLTLCAESEGDLYNKVPDSFHWQRLVLPDSHYAEPLTPAHLASAVAILHQHINQQQAPVYVHCLAGMERSPSVCVSYLCLHQGMEVWEALNWVKQRNSRTSLNSTQVQAIQALVQQSR